KRPNHPPGVWSVLYRRLGHGLLLSKQRTVANAPRWPLVRRIPYLIVARRRQVRSGCGARAVDTMPNSLQRGGPSFTPLGGEMKRFPLFIVALLLPFAAEGQNTPYNPMRSLKGPHIGGSSNIHILGHLPIGYYRTTADIHMEQELSR